MRDGPRWILVRCDWMYFSPAAREQGQACMVALVVAQARSIPATYSAHDKRSTRRIQQETKHKQEQGQELLTF